MKKNYGESLAFHLVGLLVVTLMVASFGNHFNPDGDAFVFSRVLLLLGISALGHFLVLLKGRVNELPLVAFYLVDVPIVFVLVRESGASTSPFLVLYPLLSLAGSVGFRQVYAFGYLAFVLGFHLFSVGFGPTMVGNAMATMATSVLGMYLVKALRTSDAALEVSEGQRRRLENLQRAILANIPSGLISVDSQGRIIQINSVGLKILGVAEDTILFKPLKALLPALSEQVLKLNTLVPSINQFANENERASLKYQSPQGVELHLGFSVARLQDPLDQSVLGSLVVFQDLTHILKMEDDLRLSEKLAAVGKLAAGIAHEIRNPLAGISGSAQLLMGASDLGSEDKTLLAIIQRESVRLDGLITEFLEYVRPAKAKMERVDLLKIVEHVVAQMKVHSKWKAAPAELKINNLAHPQTEVWAKGDANKITQVLINLLINSAQAGSQKIEVRISDNPPLVEVADDGSGISVDHQKRLFEPFFTTKESGTGLGLAVCYRVLEAMEAKIEVRSPVVSGHGTSFKVNFKNDFAA